MSIHMPQKTKDLIESATEHAMDALLNQAVVDLSTEQAAVFTRVLENSPAPMEKLTALMKSRAP
jgi:uncharacterized protein (DUF1778 family)